MEGILGHAGARSVKQCGLDVRVPLVHWLQHVPEALTGVVCGMARLSQKHAGIIVRVRVRVRVRVSGG